MKPQPAGVCPQAVFFAKIEDNPAYIQVKGLMKMKSMTRLFCSLLAATLASPALAADPYPLEYFALREVVNTVTVSPDGEKLAMLKILTRTGNPILHIYDTDNQEKDPMVIDADPMEIRDYAWASDEHIVLTLRQKVRDKIEGQNQGVYETRFAILDVKNNKFDEF